MPSEENGKFGKFFAWLGNDSYEVDVEEADKKTRKEYLILEDDEHLAFAFNDGRDKTFFTNKRIIIRDKQGASGLRVQHDSITYDSIRAFSVESADRHGFAYLKIDFMKGHADIFAVQRLQSAEVLGHHEAYSDKCLFNCGRLSLGVARKRYVADRSTSGGGTPPRNPSHPSER